MVDEQILQFENQGFLHLPGLLQPDLVGRLKTAFDAASVRYHDEWQAAVREGKASAAYYDIPNILDQDDSFVELVDHPGLLPLMLRIVGADIQLNHTHARLFPPGKTFTAAWHSDLADVIGIDLAHSTNFFVKVHFYFEDLSPDQGCLGFLPGTHRLPPNIVRPRVDGSSPAAVKIVPKAGDAVIFNTHVLHMAHDNTSGKVRKSLIYAYSHYWVKHYANAAPSDLAKYATTKLKRQLFGVEEEGVSYFDQRYEENVNGSHFGSIRAASRKLVKRLPKMVSVSWKR
jgi:phytanoyl-CoA hydroxylase